MTTTIDTTQAYLYFNVYFMTSIYFGSGVIELNKKQEAELKRIYKGLILRKIVLSVKYPKKLLYARRSVLGVELIAPNTALAIAALKLYAGNKKMHSRVYNLMQTNEYSYILSGTSNHPITAKIKLIY